MAKFDYKVKSVHLTKFDIKSNLNQQPNKTTHEIKFDLQSNQIWPKVQIQPYGQIKFEHFIKVGHRVNYDCVWAILTARPKYDPKAKLWPHNHQFLEYLTPSPANLVSQQTNPSDSRSILTWSIWASVCHGEIRAYANPPPPAPVNLACIFCWAVMLMILSSEGWDTPKDASKPWLVSTNS